MPAHGGRRPEPGARADAPRLARAAADVRDGDREAPAMSKEDAARLSDAGARNMGRGAAGDGTGRGQLAAALSGGGSETFERSGSGSGSGSCFGGG